MNPSNEPKVGRPSDYSKELSDMICSQLAQGISLRTICESEDMPSRQTVFSWMRLNKEFLDQYARAKEESADAMNEELMQLGDLALSEAKAEDPKISNAVVSAVKLKADNMKWMMSKMKPKKYGDKIDMTTNGKDLPTPIYQSKSADVGTN